MTSVERCVEYSRLPEEGAFDSDAQILKQIPLDWPSRGFIRFKNVSLKYSPSTDFVLHNLNFEINENVVHIIFFTVRNLLIISFLCKGKNWYRRKNWIWKIFSCSGTVTPCFCWRNNWDWRSQYWSTWITYFAKKNFYYSTRSNTFYWKYKKQLRQA